MVSSFFTDDKNIWCIFTLPAILESKNLCNPWFLLLALASFLAGGLLAWAVSSGGLAWKNGRHHMGRISIPGPRGLPIFGSLFGLSHGLAHRTLSSLATSFNAKQLMAFSVGSTPTVVASDPQIAREILTSPHFANRPIKESAKQLMFSRAIGFAPDGAYWRLLRRIASSHLFAPRLILAHEGERQLECASMLHAINKEQSQHGHVMIRKHLQRASLNNILEIVFGKRYDFGEANINEEAQELQELVREGFEILGSFNWSDHLPWLKYFYDPSSIQERCARLIPRVKNLVKKFIQEYQDGRTTKVSEKSNFVHVLMSLEGEEKLGEDDMIAVLWEMIFRGTDTTALLTEWIMAELVLNPDVQARINDEIVSIIGKRGVTDGDIARLPYLQAVVKETLRLHPPGPLLSWARLSSADVSLSNGMVIPANTVAMVNMWAITHDSNIWAEPLKFKPERFVASEGGENVDVRGNDLRLAPFGAGRRVCPGKNLGLATVSLWVAKLVQNFEWVQNEARPVELDEVLKLSSEMRIPLSAHAIPRDGVFG